MDSLRRPVREHGILPGMEARQARALSALAAQGHGAFRWGDAVALGIDKVEALRLVRHHVWVRLRHGVYALAPTAARCRPDARRWHLLLCAAEQLALGFDPVFSHESAAIAHGMPYLGTAPERPVVTRERHRDNERSERPGLHLAGLPASHLTYVHGLPMTSPARVAVDLARKDGVLAGVVAADAALVRGSSYDDLEAVATHCWHWPGGASGMTAVRRARHGAESALETVGRCALVDQGVAEPELQVELWRRGRFVARLDQLWREQLLVAEADGAVKYLEPWSPRKLLDEKRRQEDIEQCGLAVLRYDWDEATHRPRQLRGRWDAKAATAWMRRLEPGVELRATAGRRAA